MKISVQENPTKPGTYRIVLHPGRRASFDDFLNHIEGSTALTRGDALACLTAAADWVRRQALEGREADLGPLGRSRLGMKGTFDQRPERIDDSDVTLTVSWILRSAFKRSIAKQGGRLVRERVAPGTKAAVLAEARRIMPNALPDDVPGRYAPGCGMRIYGTRLDFDQTMPDEGVFLVTPAGVETRMEQAFIVQPKQIMFLMPADAAGPYGVVVRRRHPKEYGDLLTGRLDEAIVPA